MPQSDRWAGAGAQMPYIDRDRARDTSNKSAQRSAGWYSNDAYMSEVGKEGIKRQQERMRDAADSVTDPDSPRVATRRPTRATIKRTPPKAAARRR